MFLSLNILSLKLATFGRYKTNYGKAERAAWKNCPYGNPEGTTKGKFFQAAPKVLHTYSDFHYPGGQSGTFEPKGAFRLSLGTAWRNCV